MRIVVQYSHQKHQKQNQRLEKIKAYEARDDYSDLIAETLDSVQTYLFDKNGRVVIQDMREQEVKKEEKEDFSDLL